MTVKLTFSAKNILSNIFFSYNRGKANFVKNFTRIAEILQLQLKVYHENKTFFSLLSVVKNFTHIFFFNTNTIVTINQIFLPKFEFCSQYSILLTQKT